MSLSDRELIQDLHIRYGRAVDSADLDLVRTCYTDDATWQYDAIDAPGPIMRSWDEFRSFWDSMQAPMSCMHQFTNFTYDFGGDECHYTCLGFAQHWPRDADFSREVTLCSAGVRYECSARRTAAGWLIYKQHNVSRWLDQNGGSLWGR